MAAAIIPLVTSLIPVLAPVAISLVQAAEKAFGAGTGPTKKKPAVVDTLSTLATALGATFTPSDLSNLVELVVSLLKSQGQLGGPAPATITGQNSTTYQFTGRLDLMPPAANITVSGG